MNRPLRLRVGMDRVFANSMRTISRINSWLRDPYATQVWVGRVVPVIVGVVIAVLLGYWIGSQQQLLVYASVSIIVGILIIAGLRERAWALIPLGWAFVSGIALLPLPLSIREICVLLATGAAISYHVFVRSRSINRPHVIDGLLVLNLLWLAFTYVLHPVGFRAMGAETIGGRPYLNSLVAVMAYWSMLHLCKSEQSTARIPLYILIGSGVGMLLNLIAYVFPSLAPVLSITTSAVDVTAYWNAIGIFQSEGFLRLKWLGPFGITMVLYLCASYPTASLFSPRRWRFYLMGLGLSCVGLSGFRNFMLIALVAFCLGAWLHGGWRHFVITTAGVAVFFGLVIIGQGRLYELPMPAQRTLSFLPGKWSAAAAEDARTSSRGRFEWWEKIIKYKLIQNWWCGDGFGVAMRDYQGWGRNFEEDVYLGGAYHSGPLSAIRYAGIIGLVLWYSLAVGSAVYAYRCVKQCRGTILFPAAVFLAIQLIWGPVHFTFIFGGYDNIPDLIFQIACLRVLLQLINEAAQLPSTSPLHKFLV